jgi:hypothetical protein
MPRIKTSNCVSCLVWFGAANGGIQKNAKHIFLKEANAAASQLRSPAGWGGENHGFKRCKEIRMQSKRFLG